MLCLCFSGLVDIQSWGSSLELLSLPAAPNVLFTSCPLLGSCVPACTQPLLLSQMVPLVSICLSCAHTISALPTSRGFADQLLSCSVASPCQGGGCLERPCAHSVLPCLQPASAAGQMMSRASTCLLCALNLASCSPAVVLSVVSRCCQGTCFV